MNELIDSASHLLLGRIDIDKNQEEMRNLRDSLEKATDDTEPIEAGDDTAPIDDTRKQVEFVGKIYLLMKTTEILGQILKNYYGSLERPIKAALLHEVFDAPLRFLRAFFAEVTGDPESFVKELEGILEERLPKLSSAKKRQAAKKVAFHLLGMLCTGIVARTAQYVNAHKLSDDISALVRSNPNYAYRLIGAATRLIKPGQLPYEEIRKVAKDLKQNHFAFTILQSLAVYHLHLFHTRDTDKESSAHT